MERNDRCLFFNSQMCLAVSVNKALTKIYLTLTLLVLVKVNWFNNFTTTTNLFISIAQKY